MPVLNSFVNLIKHLSLLIPVQKGQIYCFKLIHLTADEGSLLLAFLYKCAIWVLQCYHIFLLMIYVALLSQWCLGILLVDVCGFMLWSITFLLSLASSGSVQCCVYAPYVQPHPHLATSRTFCTRCWRKARALLKTWYVSSWVCLRSVLTMLIIVFCRSKGWRRTYNI